VYWKTYEVQQKEKLGLTSSQGTGKRAEKRELRLRKFYLHKMKFQLIFHE
jgi:hypothetical protein